MKTYYFKSNKIDEFNLIVNDNGTEYTLTFDNIWDCASKTHDLEAEGFEEIICK